MGPVLGSVLGSRMSKVDRAARSLLSVVRCCSVC